MLFLAVNKTVHLQQRMISDINKTGQMFLKASKMSDCYWRAHSASLYSNLFIDPRKQLLINLPLVKKQNTE